MTYLSYDIYSLSTQLNTQLKDISNKSATVTRNTESMVSSLDSLQWIMERGFIGVQSELSEISHQLDDMLDVMIDFRNTQFMQNEERNQLLASIDATLKAPNKTAAYEKYEISLELANKNKNELAVKFLKEAIELNPLHFRSYIQLTLNLLKIQNYEEAIHYAKESINFTPDDIEIVAYTYSLVALAYEKTKQYKEALHYINQAIYFSDQIDDINYNDHTDYTYARARYYAFLNDVNRAMSELKTSIENNYMYFAISLADSAFHPYHQEREQLLTSMKKEIEEKLNNGISQMEALKFYVYNNSRLSDCELEYDGFDNSTIDYRYNHLHPSFKQYRSIHIAGIKGKLIKYSYNSLLEEFNEHYHNLHEFYKNQLPLIKQLKSSNTFVDYIKSYNEFIYFKIEFNLLVKKLTRLVNEFKGKSETAKQTFKENLELTIEISGTTKKRLQDEKGKKIFNLLGVVGAIILPRKILPDHMAENCLEEIYKRVKKVTEEAQKNVENEEKNSLEIQRFADEVLINKPLPNTLN